MDGVGLLNTIEKDLEDIRSTITCRVCVRPLYEPFTIECGHTFCYICLKSWFEKNSANKTCPDCRAKITRKPAPAYLVREITQLFSNRAELLPQGETTQEHQNQQREEARVIEEDRRSRGLFRGCFRHYERRVEVRERIIIDDEDGVSRCPICTWEVEDGACAGCGWPREADYSDDVSTQFSMAAEEYLMGREMGFDAAEFGSRTGMATASEILDETSQSGDSVESGEPEGTDESDDESVGSLDEFVDNYEQNRAARPRIRLSRRQLEYRFPSLGSRNNNSENSGTNTSNVSSISRERGSDIQAPEYSSNDETETDFMTQLENSRYVDDAGSLQYRRSSDTIRGNRMALDGSDDNDTASDTIARHHPMLLRNQVNAANQPEVFPISSDSDEPLARPEPRRRRFSRESSHHTDRNQHLTRSDSDDVTEITQMRADRRNQRGRQAMRGRLARLRASQPMGTDEDDADSSDENTRPNAPCEQAEFSGWGDAFWTFGGEQHWAQGPPRASDTPISEAHNNERPSRSLLDPTTSVPIRQENINMPGAFPPSFVSEQGQSQPIPRMTSQNNRSTPSPHRSSAGAAIRQGRWQGTDFLERTSATQTNQSHRRDRSAQKSARRQDRQRLKAQQEARGRRNDEPSVAPSAAR